MRSALTVRHDLNDAVSAYANGIELFRYVYAANDPQWESPRPYFHPLRSLAGDVVTVYRPNDHL